MHLASIHLYPVKSLRGLEVASADVEARGLRDDRRWMVIDHDGRFVTARKHPRMLLIAATVAPDGVDLVDADGDAIHVAMPPLARDTVATTIWNSGSPARVADMDANAWLSRRLGADVRLVHMADDCVRSVSKTWSEPGDIVSFADGFPLLLIGSASLAGLNERLARPVAMANFRPNLVVATDVPHIEDSWKRVRIGGAEFAVSKPCTRCVLTTIDPADGRPDAAGEPLRTLKGYRREALGVTFGMNLLVRGHGRIASGQPIEVLE